MTNQPLLRAPQLLLFYRKNFLFEIFSNKIVIIMLLHLYDELFHIETIEDIIETYPSA